MQKSDRAVRRAAPGLLGRHGLRRAPFPTAPVCQNCPAGLTGGAGLGFTAVLNGRGAVPPDSSPSPLARTLAFSAIIVAGACGGLIGFAVTDLGCDDGCTTGAGLVGLAAAVVAASGVAVVTVLVLRASAEWRAAQPTIRSPGGSSGPPPVDAVPSHAERGPQA